MNRIVQKGLMVAAAGSLLWTIGVTPVLAQAPVIFKAVEPVGPNDTALLFGDNVTAQATAEGLRFDDELVSAPPSSAVHSVTNSALSLTVLQATDLSAKVLIPADWQPGVYAVRINNGGGASEWQFLNRPEIWWLVCGVGGNAEPGGDVRICGLNLGAKSRVWLQPDTGAAQELPVKDAREYDLTATVPADAAPGHYRVWVHNGRGGAAGFGEPMDLNIVKPTSWPAQRFDVRKYGATGDGKTDDSQALASALAAAQSAGGGVVWIPRGTYVVTAKLNVPEHTIVQGESRDLVWLKVPMKAAPFDAVLAGNGNFGVEDLSVVGQTVKRLVACPDIPSTYAAERANWSATDPAPGGVILRRLRLQHLNFAHRINMGDLRRLMPTGETTIALRGPDCEVSDCVIVSSGMPIQIAHALRLKILRNQLGTGRNGWYGIWDFEDGLFEGNEILGRDLEGSYGGVQGLVRRVLFRDNDWHDAYGDEREALTFDTPYHPQWVGSVKMDGPASMHLAVKSFGDWPPKPGLLPQWAAVIVGGKGLGQLVPVDADPTGLTLKAPWKVPPDDSSIVAIVTEKSNVIITDNRFSDSSAAPQLYAQSYSFVVSHNQAERTGGTYANAWHTVDSRQKQRLSYAFFNQWLYNDYLHGFVYDQGPYAQGFLGCFVTHDATLPATVLAIGNRYEHNTLDAATDMGVESRGSSANGPAMMSRDAIFENNSCTDLPNKIVIGRDAAYSLLRNNGKDSDQPTIDDQGIRTLVIKSDSK